MSDHERPIPAHGGYQDLKSYQMAEIIYDATVDFCDLYIDHRSRTRDQMIQAARSGKQNIAEGSMAAATSRKMELKLTGVARASLEELRLDCLDFLRQRGLRRWAKNEPQAKHIRSLAYKPGRSYAIYRSHIHAGPEPAANTLICLAHQATYLLRRQLAALEDQFLDEGGFSERLYAARQNRRRRRR
jgi:four helix bundle suffix protein